jgi:nucleotide-binding universal stress UspA family protein
VEAAVRRLEAQGIRAQGEVAIGDVPREIARQALRSRADLVVLGSHRVDLRGRSRGFGTTSYKAAILCDCPVLLVK